MELLREFFIGLGLNQAWSVALSALLGLLGALLAGYLLYYGVQRAVFRLAKPALAWQKALKARHTGRSAAWSMAVIMFHEFVLPLVDDWPWLQKSIGLMLEGLLVLLVTLTVSRVIAATTAALETSNAAGQRLPFKVMGQALQTVLWSYGSVVLLSVLTERDVSTLMTGMTAVGAVLVYVFRDSILGWVAGVQIAGNDLACHGDWITVPGHGADGEVIDIALTTIKVRNWDQTISTIPSYALVSEGFRNWRGMAESGGRRITRSLFVDAASMRFCDQAMMERLRGDTLIQGALGIQSSLQSDQDGLESDALRSSAPTNLSLYRRWLQAWLVQHPLIHDDMPCMVRELESAGRGVPVQIYAFSREQRWPMYERLQADICDFALAVLPQFELRLFQEPSGADIHAAGTDAEKDRAV